MHPCTILIKAENPLLKVKKALLHLLRGGLCEFYFSTLFQFKARLGGGCSMILGIWDWNCLCGEKLEIFWVENHSEIMFGSAQHGTLYTRVMFSGSHDLACLDSRILLLCQFSWYIVLETLGCLLFVQGLFHVSFVHA